MKFKLVFLLLLVAPNVVNLFHPPTELQMSIISICQTVNDKLVHPSKIKGQHSPSAKFQMTTFSSDVHLLLPPDSGWQRLYHPKNVCQSSTFTK